MEYFSRIKSFSDQDGFSIIELLIYLAIVGTIMTLVMTSFIGTLSRSGHQTTIAGTLIETGIGLDILRRDLEHAGYGLPWGWQNASIIYSEPVLFSGAPRGIPQAFSSQDISTASLNTSDYLVIRASNIARGDISQKWGFLGRNASQSPTLENMNQGASFAGGDHFIVLNTESEDQFRQLIMMGSGYVGNSATLSSFAPAATPNDPNGIRYVVYGLKDDSNITRPFHRVDYYISNVNVPQQCASGTGVLGKLQINQADNNGVFLPLVDCVADFQVVYYLDTNGNGSGDTFVNANGVASLSAEEMREQVKRIDCFILAHEGTRDRDYTMANNIVNVGETDSGGTFFGNVFDLASTIGGNWANYRWKVYSLTVNPKNLQ